jgi:Planctomycete cytochrome C
MRHLHLRPHAMTGFVITACLLWSRLSATAFGVGERAAFLEQHCYDCHDGDEKKGGFDLTSLNSKFSYAETFAM